MTDAELTRLAANALAQAEAEDADARKQAEYERRNAEAVRLHLELHYPYPPPAQTSPVADLEAQELLIRAEALRDDARTRKVRGAAATQWLHAAADIERTLRSLQRDFVLPERIVKRLWELLEDFGSLPADLRVP